MEMDSSPSQTFYSWIHRTLQSPAGVAKLVFVGSVIAFSSEAVNALYARIRDRPMFMLSSRTVTLALHNLLAAACHGLHLAFTFTVMAIIMTFDPYICLAVLLGGVIGHLVCHWKMHWPSEYQQKITW